MTTPEDSEVRVRQVLEQELEQIDCPEAAEAVVARVEQLAIGKTEAGQGQAAASRRTPAAVEVERADDVDEGPSPPEVGLDRMLNDPGRADQTGQEHLEGVPALRDADQVGRERGQDPHPAAGRHQRHPIGPAVDGVGVRDRVDCQV